MPWSTSDRRQRLPRNWRHIVARIRRRDKDRCQVRLADGSQCPNSYGAIDHIRNDDDHRDENLRVICDPHHAEKTGKESAAGRAANRRKQQAKFRRTEQHPGLVG
ncbi:hypothetical protein CLV30_106123 [Haloactinopolyspora alba]|uniref:HNH endonuclease n=1 Tax=Haloactinopolyspora alba TaxID=648780 RepID=A0A2P8E3S5_9ACTN|nr:hypothetical protein CLV30_106123 [Haloactinopolyspora alba]